MLTIAQALPDADPSAADMIARYFPELPCPYEPCGGWVAVQDMNAPEKIGSLFLPDSVQDDGQYKQTVGRIVMVGPLAGWDEIVSGPLPAWPWYEPGHFVKLSAHSSMRWEIDEGRDKKNGKKAVFRLIWWKDIAAKIVSTAELLRAV